MCSEASVIMKVPSPSQPPAESLGVTWSQPWRKEYLPVQDPSEAAVVSSSARGSRTVAVAEYVFNALHPLA